MADHRTKREIGRLLGVSVRAAESHVDHVLANLGRSNRLELTAWAQRNGLVAVEQDPSSPPSCSG